MWTYIFVSLIGLAIGLVCSSVATELRIRPFATWTYILVCLVGIAIGLVCGSRCKCANKCARRVPPPPPPSTAPVEEVLPPPSAEVLYMTAKGERLHRRVDCAHLANTTAVRKLEICKDCGKKRA